LIHGSYKRAAATKFSFHLFATLVTGATLLQLWNVAMP